LNVAIPRKELRQALRLMVITDAGLARPRTVSDVVEAALRGGARAIQLREKNASARELLASARHLRALTLDWNALLIINDRFDVALASEADGVHLGPHDLPVAAVRAAAPAHFLIGHSTDQVEVARRAVAQGADYIGCGAVFPTTTKDDAGEAIGVEGLALVADALDAPVVGIGGISPEGARAIAQGSRAVGVAVIGAVMGAEDAEEAVRALLAPFASRP
jgi:thiamine-phosphate pyrophosphorylase